MYAIIEAGGKQYKVSKGDEIEIDFLNKKEGTSVNLNHVLLATKGKKLFIGNPYIKKAKVACEILKNIKNKKVITFKYKRRKSSKVKKGHRQLLTRVKVIEIHLEEE